MQNSCNWLQVNLSVSSPNAPTIHHASVSPSPIHRRNWLRVALFCAAGYDLLGEKPLQWLWWHLVPLRWAQMRPSVQQGHVFLRKTEHMETMDCCMLWSMIKTN